MSLPEDFGTCLVLAFVFALASVLDHVLERRRARRAANVYEDIQ